MRTNEKINGLYISVRYISSTDTNAQVISSIHCATSLLVPQARSVHPETHLHCHIDLLYAQLATA